MSKLVNSKKLNLERCIICQDINDIRGGKKLTSTDNRRRNVIKYSSTLQDNLLCGIDEHDFQDIRESVIEQIKRNQIVLLVPVTQETCRSSKR